MLKSARLLPLVAAIAFAIPASADDSALTVIGAAYAAKFDCGKAGDDDGVRGTVYATSINIHNRNGVVGGEPVTLEKRVIVANREGEPRGEISATKVDTLDLSQALRVDCGVISRLLSNPPPHVEGFIEIEASSTLDVVGIYTARTFNGEISSLDVVVYNSILP
jgi:hypothetical protein